MKTFFLIVFAGLASAGIAIGQVDTARNVVHSTVRGTKKAAETVAHGVKKAADTVEDAITPDEDARRVEVTMTADRIDMPRRLETGKTAFVVKNDGNAPQNFEVEGTNVDRKFVAAPAPGQTKVMHVFLKRGTYTVYSAGKDGEKRAMKMKFRVK